MLSKSRIRKGTSAFDIAHDIPIEEPINNKTIAVIYTLFLALVLYREISVKDLPKIFLESVITTAIVLL
ncbi:hypothetical protein EKL20_19885, partial [Escherichia coli]|nr:hypothetical protein [Escherichia coli]